jgi:5-methylcytosine-specific restriction endonuclease McrA
VRSCKNCGEELAATKRSHAVFCSRNCKSNHYSKTHPATPGENAARYLKERDRRLQHAKDYQRANPQVPQRAKRKRKALLTGNGVYRVNQKDWAKELERHDHKCFYCKKEGTLTMDHIIPASRGGVHSVGNLVPACKSCNSSKRDRTIMEWRMKLPAPRQKRERDATARTLTSTG